MNTREQLAIRAGNLEPQIELARYRQLTRIVSGGFFVTIFVLAAVLHLQGAVIAFGELNVATKVKKLTHPTGGVIAAINVRDGDHVSAGQVLMRFDTNITSVAAEATGNSLDQMLATQSRLVAERDGAAAVDFPVRLLANATPSTRQAIAEERNLFFLRRNARASQRAELGHKIAEAEHQIRAYQAQIDASDAQGILIAPEQKGLEDLYQKKFVTLSRVNELKRTAVALKANSASLRAQIAQTRAQISDYRQQMIQLDQDARAQAGNELMTVNQQVSEQTVRKVNAADAFDRSSIRAPQAGIVDKLAFNTVGATVAPNQPIMELVPSNDRMTVESKIAVNDVDKVRTGQTTELHFTAFNTRTTPTLRGIVRTVSADKQSDERTGTTFYTVLIEIPPNEIKKLGNVQLVPGMPVEAYIQTSGRSMLSFLLKPIADQFSRSFRQD
ncbi:HlyD family secretion protein [Sphingomonas vulcanisoli]|uniref:Membrane fusion protein (MFP) family protein n=1 Tax=Sphingomonas vulcanisoli TaxID=1658060 RepID=A0ABX0TUC4_9SPHN|nr:HlyD family type I secretion periplasmic adaptor subunit [Sphingomonas vulcanisoli]NIJ09051.1 HlyD family secretion protein [Sphingomonas vulcanisoli]